MNNNMPGFYFALWCEDQRSLQITRLRNMLSDVESGSFSPFSDEIMEQWNSMVASFEQYEGNFSKFSGMTIGQIDNWCYHDLVDRGVIE